MPSDAGIPPKEAPSKAKPAPFREFKGFPKREVNPVEETPPVPWAGLPPRGQVKEE